MGEPLELGDPLDQWTSIKPELLLRSPCYRNTSTLDLISTHASPLRTRPACLSPSHCEKSTRLHPPHREASLQIVISTSTFTKRNWSTNFVVQFDHKGFIEP